MANYPRSGINEEYIAKRLKEIDPANNPIYNSGDDIASALLFKAVFGRFVRYNATAKSWYVYDGIRWKPDPGNLTVETYAKLLTRSLWVYSTDVQSKDFRNYVNKIQQRPKRKTMIDDARDLLPVKQECFDADPYLFNCQNGVLNLKEHAFFEHDPDLLLSKVANVIYDPDARSDLFDTFLDR